MRLRMLLGTLVLFASLLHAADVTVKGVATDAKGNPVAGAKASLFYQQSTDQSDEEPRQVVETDIAGAYTFTAPLKFAAAHGTDWADHYVITVSDDAHAPGWALVTADDTATDREIILETPEQQEVHVKDSDDQPIAGATIQIAYAGDAQDRYPAFRTPADFASSIRLGAVKTDTNGTAMMPLPRTRQMLLISADGFGDESVYLESGPRKDPLDVRMTRGGTIKGTVTGPDDKPLAGATVCIRATGAARIIRVKTGAQGEYVSPALKPHAGMQTSVGQMADYQVYLDDARYASPIQDVRIDDTEKPEQADLVADTGTLLRVKVVDGETQAPVAGACIEGALGRRTVLAFTNDQGVIEWRAESDQASLMVRSPPGNVCFAGEPPRQTFLIQGDHQEITFELPKLQPLVTVRGHVADASGKPLPSIKVMMQNTEQFQLPMSLCAYPMGTVTGADGSFVVKGFPAGGHLCIYAETRTHHSIGTAEWDVPQAGGDWPTPITLSNAGSADSDLSADARGLNVEVAPMVGGVAFSRYGRTANIGGDGHLRIGGILPGLTYRVEEVQSGPMQMGHYQKDVELIPK